MKLDRNELSQLFFGLDLFYSGKIISLNDKKKLWDEVTLSPGPIVYVDDTDPMIFSVRLLKAWTQGKKVIFSHNLPKDFSNQWNDQFDQTEFDYGVWTSGTTGDPKHNLFSIQQGWMNASMHWAGYRDNDRIDMIIQSLPLYHSFGLVSILLTSLQFKKKLALFKQTPTLTLLSQMGFKNSLLNWTPTHLRMEARMKKVDASFLEIISIGSSQLSDSDRDILKDRFAEQDCYFTYGMTEMGPRISTLKFDDEHCQLNDLGTPLCGVQWKVVDEKNNRIYEGTGQLAVKSPTLAKNLLSKVDAEGFYLTSDVVQIQSDKSVYFIARDRSIVKKSGVRIHLPAIESKVRNFVDVIDCYLSKEDHSIYSEVPILYYVGICSEEDMWKQLKQELAPEFLPHRIYKLNQLPRNAFQKIIESELLKIRVRSGKSD